MLSNNDFAGFASLLPLRENYRKIDFCGGIGSRFGAAIYTQQGREVDAL